MPITVQTANHPAEIDQLFRARHEVYVEEEGVMKARPEGRVYDRFDAMPSTENIVARVDGRIVGGCRLVLGSEAGLPSDAYYDFSQYYQDGSPRASVGMLFVRKEHRGNPRLLGGMLLLGYHWLVSNRVKVAVAPMNPTAAKHMERAGGVVVGPVSEAHGLPFVPMILRSDEATPPFLRYVESQKMMPFIDNFQRQLFLPGEKVIEEGDAGSDAYVVATGSLEVRTRGRAIGRLGPGDLFGEVALITQMPRTATVVATEHTDVMSLSRDEFFRQIVQQPERCVDFLKLLGDRLKSVFLRPSASVDQLESLPPPM